MRHVSQTHTHTYIYGGHNKENQILKPILSTINRSKMRGKVAEHIYLRSGISDLAPTNHAVELVTLVRTALVIGHLLFGSSHRTCSTANFDRQRGSQGDTSKRMPANHKPPKRLSRIYFNRECQEEQRDEALCKTRQPIDLGLGQLDFRDCSGSSQPQQRLPAVADDRRQQLWGLLVPTICHVTPRERLSTITTASDGHEALSETRRPIIRP